MPRRPNILFILPDQLRPDFVGAYGGRSVATPNIDALAGQGTLFEDVISPSPICVPARASMLTGQSAAATGVFDNLNWLRPDRARMGIKTWPERLSEAGYVTAAIGKMHFYPWDISEGFAIRRVAEDKRHLHVMDDYAEFLAEHGERKRHGREFEGYAETKGAYSDTRDPGLQVDLWMTRTACGLIEELSGSEPFAMMVGLPSPHCPYDPPPEYLDRVAVDHLPMPVPATEDSTALHPRFVARYKRPWADLDYQELTQWQVREIRRHYAALVALVDDCVGQLIAALEAAGVRDDTVIVFGSDHGDYLGDFGLMGKTYFHEPSMRVPLIIQGPTGGTARVTEPASVVDLYATLLGLAGLEPEHPVDSIDLLAGSPAVDRVLFGLTNEGLMVRGGGWKLSRYTGGIARLANLASDPDEQIERIADPDAACHRQRLESMLADAVVGGFSQAHADKRTPQCQGPPGHPFFGRDWRRPYPERVGTSR